MPVALALVLDIAFVVIFAAVGRARHEESDALRGVLLTAWPFLVGLAVGWALVRSLSHRWPVWVGPGISVVVCTVVLGMLLRVVTGEGTAPTFVLVATAVLAVLLLGWRLVASRVGNQ
jgi:peptidoglycan/LPS O-acetylase OafA/YrhL